MKDDDKKDPNEDEELTPDNDAKDPSEEGEEFAGHEEQEFSFEEDVISNQEDDESNSGEEGQDSNDEEQAPIDEASEPKNEEEPTNEEDPDYDGGDDSYSNLNEEDGSLSDVEAAATKGSGEHLVTRGYHEDEDVAVLDDAIEHGHMTFLEHLDDLRVVIFKCVGAFLISFVVIAVFFKKLNEFIKMPVQRAMDNHGISEALVTTSPFGVFSFLLQMGFMGGLVLSSPFILYFGTSFIAPGLTKKEKRALLPGALAALFLLLLGGTFSYTVLIPSALNVSVYFNEAMGFTLMWSADRYMNLLLWMILGVGLLFEFPLVLAILVYVGILSQIQLKTFRRYAIVIIFVLAAFMTPTQDPITLTIMAVPLMVLYEGSIFLAGFIERRKKREYEKEFGSWENDDEDDLYHD